MKTLAPFSSNQRMNGFRLLIGLLILFISINWPLSSIAQDYNGKKFYVAGRVFDKYTEKDIPHAKLKLMSMTDSTVVLETEAYDYMYTPTGKWELAEFSFYGIINDRPYMIEASADGYETMYYPLEQEKLKGRVEHLTMPIMMIRAAKVLSEVSVTASKVKFYNKGDTIVYNADAFILAEGTMLDGLLRQMPGVELKDDGGIYVNGEYVEELLLNGKDFFKGDNKVMLENIGAYTVKNIEVYRKQKDIDRVLGEGYGVKSLAMDVKLKKEYNQGMMINAEAGYGTDERYLGRLFGMWFSDRARVAAVGNLNNLNDDRKPGEQTGFDPNAIGTGVMKNLYGGLDYYVGNRKEGWWSNGRAVLRRSVLQNEERTFRTNFLESGDTHDRQYSNAKSKNIYFYTDHQFAKQKEGKYFWQIQPKLEYTDNDVLSDLTAATFSEPQPEATREFIENIYSGIHTSALQSLINRNLSANKSKGHKLFANLWSNGRFVIPGTPDAITYLVAGKYTKSKNRSFERFGINYGQNPDFAEVADRYIADFPNHISSGKAAVGYNWNPAGNLRTDIYYEYFYQDSKATSDLFRLEQLYNGSFGDTPLGYLPSMAEYQSTIDPSLSYVNHTWQDLHKLSAEVDYYLREKFSLNVGLPVLIDHQGISYTRGSNHKVLNRRKVRLGEAYLRAYIMFSGKKTLGITGSFKHEAPDLLNMIDIRDDRNPLNIKEGNPDLKDASVYNLSVNLRKYGNTMQYYAINFGGTSNALAAGYIYNPATGVRTSKIYNINGNRFINLRQEYQGSFGPKSAFSFRNTTELGHVHSVDLMSESGTTPARRAVNNWGAAEKITLTYNFHNSRAGIFFDGDINRYESKLKEFNSFNAATLKYGAQAVISLPANLQISTDFTIYMRRGYSDPDLNTNNYVWNGRLSYNMPKAGLTFMLDGFDLLHDLSNVQYRVNAQARTETYRNVIPRYVLFHVQWKFNKQPKKK